MIVTSYSYHTATKESDARLYVVTIISENLEQISLRIIHGFMWHLMESE